MKARKVGVANRIAVVAAVFTTAVGLSAVTSTGASASSKKVITFAYSTDYVFDSTSMAANYVKSIQRQYDKLYPDYTLKLVPISGSNNQIVTTLSLMYRSASTAPDVSEIPTGLLGELEGSNSVLNITKYVNATSWWPHFPASLKAETTIGGKVYGVNEGMNDVALWYSKAMLTKAGIALPWKPTSWADILSAAEAVKKSSPNVSPLWLMAGNGSEIAGTLQGGANLILGSTTPYIANSGGKFVVDSPGLRQVLGFYKTVAQKGLDSPLSELVNPNALALPESYLAKKQVAIVMGGNYIGDQMVTGDLGPGLGNADCSPCITNATSKIGVVGIPHETGGGTVSTISGWDFPVYSGTKYPQAAFNVIKLLVSETNMLEGDNSAGWPPDDTQYANAPLYDNFSPVFNAFFAKLLPDSQIIPASPDAVVWSAGFNNATEALLQNPSLSVSDVVNTMKQYVTGQLGASKTVTVK
jgi:multiple sugar transport system substrate-binding protein